MRLVLDTNVLLSALMRPAGVPARILEAWRARSITLVMSEAILEETAVAITSPKVRSRITLNDDELATFLAALRFEVELVDLTATEESVPADPKDEAVLATLIASKADYLVTGDHHLLALRDRHPILRPAEFVQRHL